MINFEVRDLRLVKLIVETGSLTKAANKLNITQSALSKQLLDLEDRVGASLFQRQAKGMVPSEIGKDVYRIAQDITDKLTLAELEISHRVRGETGALNLGVHCISCYSWLPDVLTLFQRQFPEVELNVTNTADYALDFEQDKIEIAITHLHPGDIKRGIAYEDLFAAELVVIMAINHPLAKKYQLELEDFADYDYYSILDKKDAPLYHYFLRPAGIEPRNFIVLNQAQALMAMVASSQGLGMLPSFIVKEMVTNGKLRLATVKCVPLSANLLIAHPESRPLSVHAKAFVEISQQMALKP